MIRLLPTAARPGDAVHASTVDAEAEGSGAPGGEPVPGRPSGPFLPVWATLLLLPVVLVVSQLAGAAARSLALAVVRRVTGQAPDALHPAGMLAGMATGAGLLAVVALALPLLRNRSPVACYRLQPAPLRVFIAAAVGTFSLGPVADVLMVQMEAWFPDATLHSLPQLHDLAHAHSFLFLWPFFAILPGISEELFFRGFVQANFRRARVAILVSALSFALFHLDPHHVVGVFPLGLFLAWVASRFGALVTIVAHTVNNTVALVTIQVSELDVGYGSDVPMPLWTLLVGLALWAAATSVLLREAPSRSVAKPG